MENKTVVAVLNESKNDLSLYDFWHLIKDDDLNDFIEDYEDEVSQILSYVVPEIMDRLKLRMAFASAGENNEQE